MRIKNNYGIYEHEIKNDVYANEPLFLTDKNELKRINLEYITIFKPMRNYKKGEKADFVTENIMIWRVK